MQLSVQADMRQALRKLQLTEQEAKKGIVRALNKTAITGRAESAREIKAAGYGLKISDIKKSVTVRKAQASDFASGVRAQGRPIPLMRYSARQTKKGVEVVVKGTRKLIEHAFIATMPNGHQGVFLRVESAAHAQATSGGLLKGYRGGAKKKYGHGLPIRELFGPSIPSAFINEAVQRAVKQAISERFPVVLAQELRYLRTIQ